MVMVGPALSQRSTNIYHSMQASIELIPHILEQHLEFPRDWCRFRRRESPAGRYERKSLFIDIPARGYIRLFLCFFFLLEPGPIVSRTPLPISGESAQVGASS